MELAVLGVTFLVLLLMGLPIAFNMLLSSTMYLMVGGYPQILVIQRLFEGMNGFALLSVPFFILTGQFMLKGHLLEALIDFVNAFLGHVKGALALVTIGTCLFMGSIVGLALAEVASLGSFLIPMMQREQYKPAFSSAVMAGASLLGPIMPPSVLMILYCIAVGRTSIAGLFLAAIIPAVLIALFQMIVVYRISRKKKLSQPPKSGMAQTMEAAQTGRSGPDAPGHHLGRNFWRGFYRHGILGHSGLICFYPDISGLSGGQALRSSRNFYGDGLNLGIGDFVGGERNGHRLGDRKRTGRLLRNRPALTISAMGFSPVAQRRVADQWHVHG